MSTKLQDAIKKVKIIIIDMDGVMTDGTIYKGNDGVEMKRFSVLDGTGVALAREAGLKLAIISGRFSPATTARVKELGLENDCYQGGLNKLIAYETLQKKYGFLDEEAVFVGDDLIDMVVMEKVGLPIAVLNAYPEVKRISKYVTETSGGEGAFREVVELILKGQDRFERVVKSLQKKILNSD
ncbi:MAG: HAD hydrolase family protein [Candidatus Marinimicrobia bacterium]|nr:HAD hydrolase family protein [Candidatus Neomarinimicrobiota bacterium]